MLWDLEIQHALSFEQLWLVQALHCFVLSKALALFPIEVFFPPQILLCSGVSKGIKEFVLVFLQSIPMLTNAYAHMLGGGGLALLVMNAMAFTFLSLFSFPSSWRSHTLFIPFPTVPVVRPLTHHYLWFSSLFHLPSDLTAQWSKLLMDAEHQAPLQFNSISKCAFRSLSLNQGF